MRILIAVALVTACGEDPPAAPPKKDPSQMRRVVEPPSGMVRPLPPYAITATEVGPYKLGQKLSSVLDKLPSGPRIARFEIPNVLHTGVIRAEDNAIVIGSDSSSVTTTFVAVVTSDVARTESGIRVGSTRKELGPFADELDRARDPRLGVPAAMRNMRLVLDKDRDRVVALVIAGAEPAHVVPADTCPRPQNTETAFGACVTGTGELVEPDSDSVTLRVADAEKPFARIPIPGLVFAAPLRNFAEGRDELVAIVRVDEPQQRTWTLLAYRFDGKKHVPVVDPTPLYQLTSAQSRWIGADLRDLDLYLELTSRPDGIEVGGLLTTRSADKVRDVVVISPVTARRRPGKSATTEPPSPAGEAPAAGVPDANPSSGSDSAKL